MFILIHCLICLLKKKNMKSGHYIKGQSKTDQFLTRTLVSCQEVTNVMSLDTLSGLVSS